MHAGRIPPELAERLEPADAPPEEMVAPVAGLRAAAVVALLLESDGPAPKVVLIERASTLRSHAGQLAFPGGKPEPGDDGLVGTALREAAEEVGLPDGGTRVLGRLATVPTPTGFYIVPYVGVAPGGWQPRGTPPEVARVLTPSMTTLADPTIHRVTGRGSWKGYRYEMHEFAIHDPPLWGATARMMWDLLRRLRGDEP